MPTLSIITATYNCKTELETTLASILSQRFTDYEIIVIDGGSTDGTLEVIEDHRDKIAYFVSEPDNGIYDAMNKGMAKSQGDYLEFLNAGDVFVNENSLSHIFVSDNFHNADVLYGEINLVDVNHNFLHRVPYREFTLENLKQYGTGTVNHQAFFIKRSIAPTYSSRYRLKGELNWYIDIVEQNPNLQYVYVKEPIVIYMQGGKGYTNHWRNLYEWMLLVHRRFGCRQNINNRVTYWNFIKYRYKLVREIAGRTNKFLRKVCPNK